MMCRMVWRSKDLYSWEDGVGGRGGIGDCVDFEKGSWIGRGILLIRS